MEKVDRLGWAVGFSLKTYGLQVGVRANNAKDLRRVREHLPFGWEASRVKKVDRLYSFLIGGDGPRRNVRRLNLLYGDHVRIARTTNVDEVFEAFESDLRLVVAEFAPRRVFVHAGVVGWKGRAIVLPGRTFTGKSTLVAELVKAGATYYSDEYAVLDSQGLVHAFRKPLEMREPSSYRQFRVTVDQLGGKNGTEPLPVGLVLITKYRDGTRWRPRKLSAGQGLLQLLENTVSARRDPQKALSALRHVVTRAEILKGSRGDANEISRFVLSRW
jgi:hypothetical protein